MTSNLTSNFLFNWFSTSFKIIAPNLTWLLHCGGSCALPSNSHFGVRVFGQGGWAFLPLIPHDSLFFFISYLVLGLQVCFYYDLLIVCNVFKKISIRFYGLKIGLFCKCRPKFTMMLLSSIDQV